VVPGNIYPNKLNEKFSGIDQTGQLLFLSHGPVSPITGAKFGKFEVVDGCDHYEIANQNVKELMTLADAEKKRLDAEASKLKECKAEEYGKLTEFIEKYEGYAGLLTAIRDNLMLEAVKKAAKKIDEGKYTDEDLKIITDFEKYIVLPKVNKAVKTYEEMLDLEGDEKKLKQSELSSLLGEIKTLNRAPYFTSAHTLKLVNNGKFDEAESLNNIVLTIGSYKNLASRVDNTVITPGVAAESVSSGKRTFTEALKKEKTRYAYLTGQESGRAAEAERNGRAVRNQIQIRTQNYIQFIQEEATKLQPGGLCQRQYWRTQRCINEASENIQVAQAELQHFNKVDEERISEYDQQAKEWGALEAQGRRHVASQNGEPLPQEPSAPAEQPRDTTRPSVRPQTQDPSVYSFNYQNPQQGPQNPQMFQQQPQMMPNQYQVPMNPYGNNNMFQQQNPYMDYRPQFLGQQNFQMPNQFRMQGGYQFNWGGGGFQQLQLRPGYFNQQYMFRGF
jgi:hypothetical protein